MIWYISSCFALVLDGRCYGVIRIVVMAIVKLNDSDNSSTNNSNDKNIKSSSDGYIVPLK